MSRKKVHRKRREIITESKYQDPLLSKFIRILMWHGKLSVAERIVYQSLDLLEEKTGETAIKAFTKALSNVKPLVKVKARRVGGATYQVPVEVGEKGWGLAIRWVIDAARKKTGSSMSQRLYKELLDAHGETGDAHRKKEETHRMAEANRAFTHYRI